MPQPERKHRVLFLCTGNACRSQMAEGLLRHIAGDRYESLSAGAHPAGFVHPLAVDALGELGIDITGQESKHILEFVPPRGTPPDLVISVCDSAARECPAFPGKVARVHWPFYDPIGATGSREQKLKVFRRIRDEIRERLDEAISAGEIDAAISAGK
jgi:arsenate reductase (thioredoxin)